MEKSIKTINVLGTPYEIYELTASEDEQLKHNDAYTNRRLKIIVIDKNNSKLSKQQLLAHEIIHAFLFESGLDSQSDWATNEEMVDWFALQLPKINKAIKEGSAK